jgi:hypothetical protein
MNFIAKLGFKWLAGLMNAPKRQQAVSEVSDTSKMQLKGFASIKNTEERKQALSRISDTSVLAEIARTDDVAEVRTAAVEQIQDFPVLSKIIKDTCCQQVRDAVIRQVKSESGLCRICTSTKDTSILFTVVKADRGQSVSEAALNRITDLETAIGEVSDLSVLAALACCHTGDASRTLNVRSAAERRLEGLLSGLAKKDPSAIIDIARSDIPVVNAMAIERITDQSVLVDIARTSPLEAAREAAIERVSCQTLLSEWATTDDNPVIRAAAVRGLSDQSVLLAVFRTDKSAFVREAAVAGITDQSHLSKVALSNEAESIRRAAVKGITQDSLLASIAEHSDSEIVRVLSFGKIDNEATFVEIAKSSERISIRLDAVRKIRDDCALSDVIHGNTDRSVRLAATEKIRSIDVLSEIAKTSEDKTVMMIAVDKITDESHLVDIVRNGESGYARGYALRRMDDDIPSEEFRNYDENNMTDARAFDILLRSRYGDNCSAQLIKIKEFVARNPQAAREWAENGLQGNVGAEKQALHAITLAYLGLGTGIPVLRWLVFNMGQFRMSDYRKTPQDVDYRLVYKIDVAGRREFLTAAMDSLANLDCRESEAVIIEAIGANVDGAVEMAKSRRLERAIPEIISKSIYGGYGPYGCPRWDNAYETIECIDPDWRTREYTLRTIRSIRVGELGREKRISLYTLVGDLGGNEYIPILVDEVESFIEHGDEWMGSDPPGAAIESLRKIGTQESIKVLRGLHDKTEYDLRVTAKNVRFHVSRALELLGHANDPNDDQCWQ